jgi:hypothetical protein
MQLETNCPWVVTYCSTQPAQGVTVARVVTGVLLTVTVTVATPQVSSHESSVQTILVFALLVGVDVTYFVVFVLDVTVVRQDVEAAVSQYVHVGFFFKNSSHPSVGGTYTVTVFWLIGLVGAAGVVVHTVHSYVG